jgi:hypothetical protein
MGKLLPKRTFFFPCPLMNSMSDAGYRLGLYADVSM